MKGSCTFLIYGGSTCRESLVRPRVVVPVKPCDNVPIFSWLELRGRCRSCAAAISARYPVVEALTAVLYALCVVRSGLDADVILPLLLVTLLVPVAAIDLEHRNHPQRVWAACGYRRPWAVPCCDQRSGLPVVEGPSLVRFGRHALNRSGPIDRP